MRRYTEIFKALSDETRLNMLGLLLKYKELCVCDFVQVMKISQSKASRHLRVLRNAGLLDDRRDGVWVYYHLHERPGKAAKEILEGLHETIASISSDKLLKDVERWLKKKNRLGNSCTNTT